MDKFYVKETVLSDGSKVYDVHMLNTEDSLVFCAYSQKEADLTAFKLNEVMKDAHSGMLGI